MAEMATKQTGCALLADYDGEIAFQEVKRETTTSMVVQRDCDIVLSALRSTKDLIREFCGSGHGACVGAETDQASRPCQSDFLSNSPYDYTNIQHLVESAQDPNQIIWQDAERS